MSARTEEWGWAYEEECGGPFETRQAAIDHACEHFADRTGTITIDVAQIERPDPEDFIREPCIDDLLDDMGCNAEEFSADDDDTFEVVDRTGAAMALKSALQEWAREFVSSDRWKMPNSTESVELSDTDAVPVPE